MFDSIFDENLSLNDIIFQELNNQHTFAFVFVSSISILQNEYVNDIVISEVLIDLKIFSIDREIFVDFKVFIKFDASIDFDSFDVFEIHNHLNMLLSS